MVITTAKTLTLLPGPQFAIDLCIAAAATTATAPRPQLRRRARQLPLATAFSANVVGLNAATSNTASPSSTKRHLLTVVEGKQTAHNDERPKREVAISFNTSSLTTARNVVIRRSVITPPNSDGLRQPISAIGAVAAPTAGHTTPIAVKD